MPYIDSTITISIILALVALIAPIITAIVNNRYQYKMKKLEFYENHKLQVVENYLQSVGKYLYDVTLHSNNYKNYGEYSHEIYLYAPPSCWHLIETLDMEISQGNIYSARGIYTELCKVFNHTLISHL